MSQIESDTTYHNTVQTSSELDQNAKNFLNYLNFTQKCLVFTSAFFALLGVFFLAKFSTIPNAMERFEYSLLMVLVAFIGQSLVRAQIEIYQFIYKTHRALKTMDAEQKDNSFLLEDIKKMMLREK